MRNQVIDTKIINDHDEDDLHNLYGVLGACKIKQKYISMIDKSDIPDIRTFETIYYLAEWSPIEKQKTTSMEKRSETSCKLRSSK